MFNPQPKPVSKKKKVKRTIKPGVKTNDWEAAKKLLKPAFEAVGITYCEIGLYLQDFPEHATKVEKHNHKFFLTWAHGDKRDNLEGAEIITLVALCCVECHNYIERMPRLEMREIVLGAIESRRNQPQTYYYQEGNL
jgi:hypothetical protein